VRNWLTDGPLSLSDGQITRAIAAVQDRLQDSAAAISSGIFSTLSAATNAVLNLVLILMLTFFFIKDGHRFLPWLATLGGQRAGMHVSELLARVWGTIGGFIRTQSLVAFIDAVLIGIGLAILGVPLAIPLAVITFFGGFIPIIGAFASGILAVLVTLVTNDFKAAVIAALIVIAVQQLEGNVLSPWLQGKTMNLHAGVVLMSVTAGTSTSRSTGTSTRRLRPRTSTPRTCWPRAGRPSTPTEPGRSGGDVALRLRQDLRALVLGQTAPHAVGLAGGQRVLAALVDDGAGRADRLGRGLAVASS
jgi:hypothetical protein